MSVMRDSADATASRSPSRVNPSAGPIRRGRRGRRVAILLVVVLGVAGAGVAYTLIDPFSDDQNATTIDSGAQVSLTPVTKGTLSARSMQNGTLSYAGTYTLVNKSSGTLTKVPKVGDIVRRGHKLYWVDGEPVLLLQGAYGPAYRALSRGIKGNDVKELNRALVTLGYTTKSKLDPTSDYFGLQTYYALKKLQKKTGLDQTGNLPLGQAIFSPAKEIRITKVEGIEGASVGPNQSIMEASSRNRQVTVELNASQQSSVSVGDQVTITLPTGVTTPGKVSSVGRVATKGDSSTTIEVLIRPLKPKATGSLDQTPVQVSIVSETAKNILSVPVNALLALAGGGYAVEVVDADGIHRLIPVKTGLFDDSGGRVEVSGTGLAVGQNVVVPAS